MINPTVVLVLIFLLAIGLLIYGAWAIASIGGIAMVLGMTILAGLCIVARVMVRY
jgi:hypothetical protein